MVHVVVQPIHAVLMNWQSGQDRRSAGGATTYASESIPIDDASIRQSINVRGSNDFVTKNTTIQPVVIGYSSTAMSMVINTYATA